MGFFDNFGSKISKMGNSISSQASTSLESTRLNSENRSLASEINTIFRKIGEEVYAAYRNQTSPELQDLFSRVEEAEAKIEENKKRIEELKSYVPCPNCGKSIDPNSEFCPFCGMPRVAAGQQQDPQGTPQTCPSCGKPMIPGTVFCTSCGYRLGTPLPPKADAPLPPKPDTALRETAEDWEEKEAQLQPDAQPESPAANPWDTYRQGVSDDEETLPAESPAAADIPPEAPGTDNAGPADVR